MALDWTMALGGTGPQRQEGGGGGYKMKKALRIFYFKNAVILRNYNFLFKVTLKELERKRNKNSS